MFQFLRLKYLNSEGDKIRFPRFFVKNRRMDENQRNARYVNIEKKIMSFDILRFEEDLYYIIPLQIRQTQIAYDFSIVSDLAREKKRKEKKKQMQKLVGAITYLKKSSLQNSFASLEKHLSCNVVLQSKQRTHSTCHARSKTFSRY